MPNNGLLYGHGFAGEIEPKNRTALCQRFIIPPFSVWDARQGFWQDRKRRWLSLGLKSEIGRTGNATFSVPKLSYSRAARDMANYPSTSVFDPVVCEVSYMWFSPEGGVVLDPFAGGSVRGVVASVLGRKYWGCELRAEQVEANKAQLGPATVGKYKPRWICGDSAAKVPASAPAADFIFTCPPYGNLETYSTDKADISNMPWKQFQAAYYKIIEASVAKLRQDRFAAIVVGNYRDRETGTLRDLVGSTIRGFRAAGMAFWNEIILVNAIGTGALRGNNTFIRGHRKVVRTHQTVLVFAKGDVREAAIACGNDPTEDTGKPTKQK